MRTDDVTDMREAEPGDVAWVYPLPREWHGEYGWTTDVSAEFEEIDDPVTIVRQRWLLVRTEFVVFHPRTELCPRCDGDGVVVCIGGSMECGLCRGDGGHPLAGRMEILET